MMGAGDAIDVAIDLTKVAPAFNLAENLVVDDHNQRHRHQEVGDRGGDLERHRVTKLGLAHIVRVFAHAVVVPNVPTWWPKEKQQKRRLQISQHIFPL